MMKGFRVTGWLMGTLLWSGVCLAQVDGSLSNPILPGDHPDPTIIRVGPTYWTASTAGNWAPEFSLYQSTDLHHWTAAGAIFTKTPAWADRDFWAPELVSDGGRVLVYYVARKRGGSLCVGVATARAPQGPYDDHGPIECQDDGSIDPAFVRDEHGAPYLIWKEDGNSQNKPTVIWAQPLTADLLHLTGEKKQLIENDPASWEGGVVEAPYILRHDARFYLFYAGNACCGVDCKYAEGVARADHLLGPWTKDPANPIIRANGVWKCPGHGTAVETPEGKTLFVYHAYPASGFAYLGRESVLDSVTWGKQGWPMVNQGRGPGAEAEAAAAERTPAIVDDFSGSALGDQWKWPIGHEPQIAVAGRKLTLTMPQRGWQSFVARPLLTAAYTASVGVPAGASAGAGLGLIGDAHDDVVLSREGALIELWRSDRDGKHVIWQHTLDPGATVSLRVSSAEMGTASFSYRAGDGAWMPAGLRFQLKELLPWDSGLRVGLVVDGAEGSSGRFEKFRVVEGGVE
jgi:xylan 1,4-beta-xylosidase